MHPLTYLIHSSLASSVSLPAEPSTSPVIPSTHIVVDATLSAPTPFPVPASTSHGIDNGSSLTSTPQIGQSPPVSFGGNAPTNSADITRPFANPAALDAISPSPPIVHSTPHTVVDATPSASTHFPIPANTGHGKDDRPSLSSTPQIGQSPPVSFGGDVPTNSADITRPFADTAVLDVISPSTPVVHSTLHTAVDATPSASTHLPIPANAGHGIDDRPSLSSTPQIGQNLPAEGDAPTNSADIIKPFADPVSLDDISPSSPVVGSTLLTAVDATFTPLPVPASTSPGINDGPSVTSTPQIGQSAPVSFGGDAPANSADSGFSDVLDAVSPAIPTPTGGQPIGGIVDTVPLTSALPPGEIGISTITAPAAISTTNFTSVPSSVVSGYVVL